MSHQAATYATTDALFAALRSGGVRDVVVSPGSRSTPLALTAALCDEIDTHVVLDERSAGFVALGMAIVSERPVALVCTSGTAAANYLPAVVEAGRSRVSIVVLTADRPPEELERDGPQTIDQVDLYGTHVRQFVGLGVAHECDPAKVIQQVGDALRSAGPPNAGPIHVNCPFDKPLEPESGWRPTHRPGPAPVTVPAAFDPHESARLGTFLRDHPHGVLVAGPRRATADELDAVAASAALAGWPILADPLSGFRNGRRPGIITTTELLVRSAEFVKRHPPDAIVRIGGHPTGQRTQAWIESLDIPHLIVDPDHRWTAPGPELVLRSDPLALFKDISAVSHSPGWVAAWMTAQGAAIARRDRELVAHPHSELAMTRTVLDSQPPLLWVAGSLPVRHVDAVMDGGSKVTVVANRGANGIDGTIASAVGAAMGGRRRVTLLLGDLAFLHDVGSLTTATELGIDMTIVVLDNQGGAIFSMLAIADRPDLPFERMFTTPHSRDLVAVAAGFGTVASRVATEDLAAGLTAAGREPGVHVLVVSTDPRHPLAAYERMVEG